MISMEKINIVSSIFTAKYLGDEKNLWVNDELFFMLYEQCVHCFEHNIVLIWDHRVHLWYFILHSSYNFSWENVFFRDSSIQNSNK